MKKIKKIAIAVVVCLVCGVLLTGWINNTFLKTKIQKLERQLSRLPEIDTSSDRLGSTPLVFTDGFFVAVVSAENHDYGLTSFTVLYTNETRLQEIKDPYVAAIYVKAKYWPLFRGE